MSKKHLIDDSNWKSVYISYPTISGRGLVQRELVYDPNTFTAETAVADFEKETGIKVTEWHEAA